VSDLQFRALSLRKLYPCNWNWVQERSFDKGTETKPVIQKDNDSEKDEDCIRKDETALSPGMQDQTQSMSSSLRQR